MNRYPFFDFQNEWDRQRNAALDNASPSGQFMPPFVESKPEATTRLGAQRADKWRQRLNALAAGLVASSGAENFGQGLARGFGGAVIGGQVYQTQEEKRQADRLEAEQAQAQREWERQYRSDQLAEEVRHNKAAEANAVANTERLAGAPRYTQQPWFLDPSIDPSIAKQAREKAFSLSSGQQGDAPIIDDQTLNDYADALATTGSFPNLGGFGKFGTQVKMMIGQRASQRHPGLNIGKVAADYKANSAALSKLTQQSSGLEAFAETARRNTDVLLETTNYVPEWGNRVMNSAARKAAAAFGNENVARFNTALETVVPEFARILQSGGMISGSPLTDQQKKDMRAVLHGDFTKGQLRASVEILRREIANRKAAQEQSIKALQGKITPRSGVAAEPPPDSDPLGIR